jgi:hypothetical protein
MTRRVDLQIQNDHIYRVYEAKVAGSMFRLGEVSEWVAKLLDRAEWVEWERRSINLIG